MFRRIEDRTKLSRAFLAREWLRYRLLFPERKALFKTIAKRRRGGRVFLLGNGPSLNAIDLDRLVGEDYVLCNMAERIEWTKGRTHPYYIAADTGVPRKYVTRRPGIQARTFFFAEKLRRRLDPDFITTAPIFWFAPAKGGVLNRGLTERPWVSVASGDSILVTAAQLAWALGYRQIYILGCDLSYAGPNAYAYSSPDGDRDRTRPNESRMIARTNAQFAVLRDAIEARGGRISNAGVGGNLHALPRVPFDTLFAGGAAA